MPGGLWLIDHNDGDANMLVQPRATKFVRSRMVTGIVPPLDDVDLSRFADAVAQFVPDWSVELRRTSNGEAVLVMMPDDADDLIQPIFVVRRDGVSLLLELFQWDTQSAVGTYATLREVACSVRAILAHLSAAIMPGSMLRH
jgi:hypothetical protein